VNDLLGLFLADLNRSIEGLNQSLDLGPDGMTQASLHARDLSDALQSVNLPRHAEIALVVSRHLAAGRPGMEASTRELLTLVKEAIDALNGEPTEGEAQAFPNQDQAISNLARAVSVFGEQSADFSSLAFQATSDSSRLEPTAPEPTSDQPVSQAESSEGVIDLEEVTGLMYFSGKESESPMARVPLSTELAGPDAIHVPKMTLHDRLYALKTIQALDHEISKAATPELAHQARLRLADHANWMTGLAQEPLQRRLVGMARTIELAGVRADTDVIDYLISAMSVLPQPAAVKGSCQHQTLFVDLAELRADADSRERASKIVQILAGRIEETTEGLRLILPSSLSRLRVVPFIRNGLTYAISWAQFLRAETVKGAESGPDDLLGSTEGTRLCLRVKSGVDEIALYANEVRPFEVMNAFLLPPAVEAPDWVAGVLVGAATEPVIWVVPASS